MLFFHREYFISHGMHGAHGNAVALPSVNRDFNY